MNIRRTLLIITAVATVSLTTNAATNIFHVTAGDGIDYTINGAKDPALTLVRGYHYEFLINNLAFHPFEIETTTGAAYNEGVSNNGATSGTITFDVPNDAPNQLKYQCLNHAGMTGPLFITDAPPIQITTFNLGTNVVIQSTGTDMLNVNVLTSTNLLTNAWANAIIQNNVYANGTNTTEVALPEGNAAFFQVEQGFF